MRVACSKILLMFFFFGPLLGCEDEMEKHYERPDWLQGSAYEILQGKGQYSQFLHAIDLAGFKIIVDGQGLCTVFAPDDAQFMTYLHAHGWSSVDNVPLDSLKVLVGNHIVQYSYKPDDLMNFQPNGVLNPATNPGIYYKHKTFGKDPIQVVTNPKTGRKIEVYKREKYLPVLSTDLFHFKKLADLEYNYKYFFPNSQWKGDNQFYVANASVIEGGNGIPTDNGYLYLIDNTLKPLRNIYDIVEDPSKNYSVFKSLYDRFAAITYDAQLSEKYGATSNDSIYVYYHNSLPKIASEWTFNYEGGFTENIQVASGTAFNAFVPNDAALESFIHEFFPAYQSREDIPLLALEYLLSNHIKSSNIVLPEEIKAGKVTTTYGDACDFDVDRTDVKEMCTNGVFYGINKVLVPAPFKTVTKPLFQHSEYNMFMNLLYKTGEIIQLTNPDNDYTLFVPRDEAFEAMGIRLNIGNADILGDEKFEKLNVEDGKYVEMTALELSDLVAMHVVPQKITDFNKQQVFPTKKSLTYIKVFGGGVAGEQETDEAVQVVPLGEYSNGVTYESEQLIGKTDEVLTDVLTNTEYSKFWALMKKAGLWEEINGVITIPMLAGETAMVFAPTNAAIDAADNIPQDSASLVTFLKYFFVTLESNKVANYVMPGIGDDGMYSTLSVDVANSNIYERKYFELGLYQDVDNFRLRLTNDKGTKQCYTLSGKYPRFTTDGIIYQIETTDIQPE